MKEQFLRLDSIKRDRIINSALQEFSEKGKKNASTNTIIKNAGISKGALFAYFGSKDELFHSLENFVVITIRNAVSENVDWTIEDFFERMKQVITIKINLINKYPFIYEFYKVMAKDKTPQQIAKLSGVETLELISKLYSYNVDYTKFREDMNRDKVMKLIHWTMEKLGEEIWNNMIATEQPLDIRLIDDYSEDYFEILKKAFYK